MQRGGGSRGPRQLMAVAQQSPDIPTVATHSSLSITYAVTLIHVTMCWQTKEGN